MNTDITLCITGEQGEGISSLATMLSKSLNQYNYHIFGYRDFSSRIKGGPTSSYLRISDQPKEANLEKIDLLLSFTEKGIEQHVSKLSDNAIIIADESLNPTIPHNFPHFTYPFFEKGKNLGNKLYGNIMALGVIARILSLPPKYIKEEIEKQFRNKKESVLNSNIQAFNIGFDSTIKAPSLSLSTPEKQHNQMILSGNQALSLGFLTGGCKFMAAYPITPASEIMEFMAKHLPSVGGRLLQAEDEIAAVTMAIGANFGGVRSITATSGPGFSLMGEAISLSGMTETPIVIVNVQRSGPSTGMPTKQEQSDMNLVLYSGHGEFSRIVLSPGSPEECFEDGIYSLNLAEQYQCPVILLSDLKLGLSEYSSNIPSYNAINIDRGKLVTQEDLDQRENHSFNRYDITEDGISPRSIPGQKNGAYHTTGIEHDAFGYINTSPRNRNEMNQKRMKKLENLELDNSYVHQKGKGKTLIIGIGSTKGVLEEVFDRYKDSVTPIDTLRIRVLSPFPKKSLEEILSSYEDIVFIENNYTSQLYHLFKSHLPLSQNIEIFNRHDGDFISVDNIVQFLEGSVL